MNCSVGTHCWRDPPTIIIEAGYCRIDPVSSEIEPHR